MRLHSRDVHKWLDCAFAIALGGACIWYLLDAYGASARATNLILILPATLIGSGLALLIAFNAMPKSAPQSPAESKCDGLAKPSAPSPVDLRVFAIIGVLFVYVLFMGRVGFDVATFLFVTVSLFILGERRLSILLVFSILFTIANIYIQQSTSYNIPLAVL